MKQNKMIIHYCGGCGANIGKAINAELAALGNGFCSIEDHYIDTSVANTDSMDKDKFYQIVSTGYDANLLDGSGAERGSNAKEISRAARSYLTENSWVETEVGTFHVIVTSASGGTGNIIATAILADLRKRSVPVLGVFIGDSSNALSAKNTSKVVATLDAIAKRVLKKPLAIVYYNNHAAKAKGAIAKETEVNSLIFNALSVVSLFLSGANVDIDTQDMINFLAPENYTSLDIKPAALNVSIFDNDDIATEDGVINLIGRTLTTEDQDTTHDLVLLHHKHGRVIESDAVVTAREITPLHMLLVGNFMVAEHRRLLKTVAEYDEIANAMESIDLDGAGDEDDNGLVL